MKIENLPFCVTDWSRVPPTEHPGENGKALWRAFEEGNIRVRGKAIMGGFFTPDFL